MAGGMLYRCRWCEKAYCEDCVDFAKTKLLGNSLPEYQLLKYPEAVQAFYIQCAACTDNFVDNPENEKLCKDLEGGIMLEWNSLFGDSRAESLQPGSLTDATTAEASSVNTPIMIDDDSDEVSTKKRKVSNEKATQSNKRKIRKRN
jgi:SWI/SNF-related matrix-associated actin-dependent regulator of chromatin subfamily A member 5